MVPGLAFSLYILGFRISSPPTLLQEILNNILKHGQPPRVENGLRATLRIFAGASRRLAVGQA